MLRAALGRAHLAVLISSAAIHVALGLAISGVGDAKSSVVEEQGSSVVELDRGREQEVTLSDSTPLPQAPTSNAIRRVDTNLTAWVSAHAVRPPKERPHPSAQTAGTQQSASAEEPDVRGERGAPRFTLNLPATPRTTPSLPSAPLASVNREGADDAMSEGQVDTRARVLFTSVPRYPEAARRAGVEADVPLQIVVDQRGAVIFARAEKPAGYGLAEAALREIRNYRFEPAQRGKTPVSVRMHWIMSFRLD